MLSWGKLYCSTEKQWTKRIKKGLGGVYFHESRLIPPPPILSLSTRFVTLTIAGSWDHPGYT